MDQVSKYIEDVDIPADDYRCQCRCRSSIIHAKHAQMLQMLQKLEMLADPAFKTNDGASAAAGI